MRHEQDWLNGESLLVEVGAVPVVVPHVALEAVQVLEEAVAELAAVDGQVHGDDGRLDVALCN